MLDTLRKKHAEKTFYCPSCHEPETPPMKSISPTADIVDEGESRDFVSADPSTTSIEATFDRVKCIYQNSERGQT